MRHRITWCSTRAVIAAALIAVAVPAYSAPPVRDDPFIGTVARYEAAAATLQSGDGDLDPQQIAALASQAITAAYFSERYQAAADLFARYQGSALDPLATVTGLGAILQTSDDAAAKDKARNRLAAFVTRPAGDALLAPAVSQATLGADAMLRDDLPGAVAFFRKAMELAQRDLPADDPAQVMFANVYGRHLQYADRTAGRAAVERTERLALDILPEGHPLWIDVWYDMAARAQSAGRFGEAAAIYARITDLAAREWGRDDRRLYPILQYRAIALSGLGERQAALDIARLAITVEGGRPAEDRAMHRELIGGLLLGEGQVAEAAASYREGLALLDGTDPGDLRWAFIQSRLARALSFLGQDADARAMAELAETGFAAKLPATHPARITAEVMIAKTFARTGDPDRAFAMLQASVATNESKMLDAYARSQDVRSVAASNNTLFRDFAWVALKTGRMEQAWRAAQLATLGELAISSAKLSYPGDPEGFRTALEGVQAARAAEADTRQQLADGKAGAAALSTAIAQREAVERQLDSDFPRHAEILRPTPLTLAETQAGLSKTEAVLIPLVVEDRNVTIVVTSDAVIWHETTSPYNSTTALIDRLRASLEESSMANGAATPFDSATAHEVYRRFFGPALAPALTGKSKLIFPAGGPLAQIPPSVLVSKAPVAGKTPRFLIRDFAIAVRPSLRPLAPSDKAPTHAFAGIGAPVLSVVNGGARSLRGVDIDLKALRALPSLPGSLAELTAMGNAFAHDDALLLTGADATEASVRAAPLGDYRVLAFSTHGLVGGQIRDLAEPALVLTPPDAPTSAEDGLLTASEIAAMDLAADWVILSACNTAAGNGRGGATYGGLARAFQVAGARSLLLSHWPVRDDAAAFLSVETLRRAETGADRAQALREAQLQMIADKAGMPGEDSPGVWGPFVLIEG
ncbi:MAG: CHAT domain-containing protein [Tsuneonella suprasediminis]|nr:CHAT domain-containing protein [Altererythrobacter sp. N1]